MRILLWHGWLLEGSGSNVYTFKVAEAYARKSHDVLLLCQERETARFPFVTGAGTVGADRITWERETGGRVALLRPEIGALLPVFVLDVYPGFDVKTFPDLSDQELDDYLERNVAALRTASEWFRPDVVITGHAVPGAAIARRAIHGIPYVAKIHGSDLEYAMRLDPRYVELAREGLEGARAVSGPTRDVLARTVEFVPSAAGRTVVIPPGVEVEQFRPMDRRQALAGLAELLDRDPDVARGRPYMHTELADSAIGGDPAALDLLAGVYDQSVPDQDAARHIRGLMANHGPIVGYLGKFIPQKGVDLFIQALALLPHRVRGLLVGFGQFREWLTALVYALDADWDSTLSWFKWMRDVSPLRLELTDDEAIGARGLWGRIAFTGRLDHRYAPRALAAMDILVVPSVLDEAFGMVAAEGAAAGALPLVARHSGLAEVAEALEDAAGEPGLFSYEHGPGAVHRIAEGTERILELPQKRRQELRRAVSGFVAREWTWDRTADRLIDAAKFRH